MKGTNTRFFSVMNSFIVVLSLSFDFFVFSPILGNPFKQTMERDKSFICPYFVEGMQLFQFVYMRYWATTIVHQL